jgi:hypothetical protein
MVAMAAHRRHTTYLRLLKIPPGVRAHAILSHKLTFRLIGNKRFTIVDRKNHARMPVMAASPRRNTEALHPLFLSTIVEEH